MPQNGGLDYQDCQTNHDTFSRNTRNQLKQVFDVLRELMTLPDPPKRHIGFIDPEDKGSKKPQARRKG